MSDKKNSVTAAKTTANTNIDKANDWTVPFDLQTMYNRYNMELTGGISQSTINSYKKQYNLNDEQAKALAILYRAQQNNPNAGSGGGGSNPDDDIEKAVKAIKNQKLEDAAKALGIKAGDLKGTIAAASDALSQYAYVDDTYIRPEYTDVTNAQIRSLNDLQSQLGTNVNYDFNSIKGIYDDATRAAYAIEQNSGAERSYYRHLADAQNTALESIRNAYGQAVTQGASKGMQAANQLSAILGFGATANEEATQLAIDKQARANEYATQMAQNARMRCLTAIVHRWIWLHSVDSCTMMIYNRRPQNLLIIRVSTQIMLIIILLGTQLMLHLMLHLLTQQLVFIITISLHLHSYSQL